MLFDLTDNDLKVLAAALNELPFKHAAPVMNKLVEQSKAQELVAQEEIKTNKTTKKAK